MSAMSSPRTLVPLNSAMQQAEDPKEAEWEIDRTIDVSLDIELPRIS